MAAACQGPLWQSGSRSLTADGLPGQGRLHLGLGPGIDEIQGGDGEWRWGTMGGDGDRDEGVLLRVRHEFIGEALKDTW